MIEQSKQGRTNKLFEETNRMINREERQSMWSRKGKRM